MMCVGAVTVPGGRRRADADVCERGSEMWRYQRVSLSGGRGLN